MQVLSKRVKYEEELQDLSKGREISKGLSGSSKLVPLSFSYLLHIEEIIELL